MTVEQDGPAVTNPLGIAGIEFIEYATQQPQALCALLGQMGFVDVGRHRSRDVALLRQGALNVIVDADPRGHVQMRDEMPATTVSAIALRVHDAAAAYRHAIDLGAWAIPTRAGAMKLNIPGIHGVGDSILYFVDRARLFAAGRAACGCRRLAMARTIAARRIRRARRPPRHANAARAGHRLTDRVEVAPSAAGALTQLYQGGVSFELVASHIAREPP